MARYDEDDVDYIPQMDTLHVTRPLHSVRSAAIAKAAGKAMRGLTALLALTKQSDELDEEPPPPSAWDIVTQRRDRALRSVKSLEAYIDTRRDLDVMPNVSRTPEQQSFDNAVLRQRGNYRWLKQLCAARALGQSAPSDKVIASGLSRLASDDAS